MIPEVLNNSNVRNLLCGASIILSVEPTVQLPEALQRSKIAEGKSDDDLDEAIRLIVQVRQELALNGSEQPDREQARSILRHLLKDPPWNGVSNKYDVL